MYRRFDFNPILILAATMSTLFFTSAIQAQSLAYDEDTESVDILYIDPSVLDTRYSDTLVAEIVGSKRNDEITIVGPEFDVTPENMQMLFSSGFRSPDSGDAVSEIDTLVLKGGPEFSMLECEPVAHEVNGSPAYAMRCIIDGALTSSEPLNITANLRVYSDGNDFWRSCNVTENLASDLEPAAGAELIAGSINSSCDNMAAGWFDLQDGRGLVDIWSTESSLLCVSGVEAFAESCDQFSWVAISN